MLLSYFQKQELKKKSSNGSKNITGFFLMIPS